MCKHHLLLSFFLLTSLFVWGQWGDFPLEPFKGTVHGAATLEFKYLQEGRDSISGIRISEPHILQLGDNFSIYYNYYYYHSDSIIYSWSGLNRTFSDYCKTRQHFHVTLQERILRTFEPEMQIKVRDRVFMDQYYYVEPQPHMQWQLSKEKKMIGSHECRKATLDFAGRNWTAWYDPSIPTPVGPWKFYGLPGAIISIADSTGSHSFTLTEIRKPGRPVLESYSNPFRIKRKRLQMLKEKWELDKASMMGNGPAAPRNLDGTLKEIKRKSRKDVYINPIHLD